MTSKVVPLGQVHAIPGPDKSTVFLLKDLLKKARAGEVKGVAVAYVDNANAINSDWTNGKADSHLIMAAIGQLWYMALKRKYEHD